MVDRATSDADLLARQAALQAEAAELLAGLDLAAWSPTSLRCCWLAASCPG
jgi:hypothetical protein